MSQSSVSILYTLQLIWMAPLIFDSMAYENILFELVAVHRTNLPEVCAQQITATTPVTWL